LTDVRSATIPGAGHFAPEDAPAAVWTRIAQFVGRNTNHRRLRILYEIGSDIDIPCSGWRAA